MRIVRVGKTISLRFTNEEITEIKLTGKLEIGILLLRLIFEDISNIVINILPKVKNSGFRKIKKEYHSPRRTSL